jgi:hypothetical protein
MADQDYSREVGQCPRMSPSHRPLHALFLPATSARRTTAKAISAVHADARKRSVLMDSVPGARQEAPQSSALRLCRPPLRYAPSTPLIAPFQGWGTPPLALAAPAGVGQGQGVSISKHSTAIQKRRNHPMTYTATYSPEDKRGRSCSDYRTMCSYCGTTAWSPVVPAHISGQQRFEATTVLLNWPPAVTGLINQLLSSAKYG